MPELRALIVDDEPLARRGIRQLLEPHADVQVVGECRNGREALRALDALAPDLVFLDVQMPGLDGFGVLRERGERPIPAVIFVTAYDEFAVRAFEAHALDYLVKPVSAARFDAALERARERMRFTEALALRERLAAMLAERDGRPADALSPAPLPDPPRRIVVPSSAGDLVLDLAEIDWIEADDYYAAIHAHGRRHLVRESLASLEERLDPARFVRVHRSAIVPVDRVRELRSTHPGETVVVLRDGTRVPVSRRRREQVRELIRRAVR
ncbi:MAG TPA: LytTR family DNA-binding domain-containing protein [Longimicrobium sp.]|nr:LytTR family DNA-binding domain-containing protein [Longimicrobium sp.]